VSPRRHRGFDIGQLRIDWRPPETEGSAGPTAAAATAGGPHEGRPEPNPQPRPPVARLVQRLPWDFATTYPPPLADAIEAGVLAEEDAEPANVKSMHEELARQLLAVLAEGDAISDARRCGTDPRTGGRPTTRAAQERLQKYLAEEPARLDRSWQSLLGAHEAAFGEAAADAFAKALLARHAGIPVVAEAATVRRHEQAIVSARPPHDGPSTFDAHSTPDAQPDPATTHADRVIARLPAPRPLPQAIAQGRFGYDEHGPVSPSPDEVREITEAHADVLKELVADVTEAERRGLGAESIAERSERVTDAVGKYAEDFGDRAAARLLAYARRQAVLEDAPVIGKGRSR
jgi:hypothetical protein